MSCVTENIEAKRDEYRHQCVIAVGEDLADDLFHDVVVQVMSEPRFEEICAKGQLTYYIMGCINISRFSSSCPFYVKYRKFGSKQVELPDDRLRAKNEEYVDRPRDPRPEMLRRYLDAYEEHNWFEANMLRIYYFHDHSYKTLSDDTGICRSTVRSVVRRAKKNLQAYVQAQEADGPRRRGGEGHGGDGDQSGS